MSKNTILIKGKGGVCTQCKGTMQRREHKKNANALKKFYFFTEWDFCFTCKRTVHYEEFKSRNWKEITAMESFFNERIHKED